MDVYLLHNPEYYLQDAEHRGMNDAAHRGKVTEKQHQEFYRRIREAFRFLEGKVAAGEIRWYGISSNNFGMPASGPTMTSVERCWEAAEAVSPQHHFRVVQLPLNLYESGGALERNNNGKTALEFCREKGIGVLANRPLNAFFANRMVRLADFVQRGEKPPGRDELRARLEPLRKLETELREQLDVPLLYATQGGMAEYLEHMLPQITSPAHWEQVYYRHVIQPVERWATECQQLYGDQSVWQEWWRRFLEMAPVVLEEAARHVAAAQQDTSDAVQVQLKLAGYPNHRASLSQMALNALLRLEGLSCALVGMRRPEYVADSLGALDLEPVDSVSILTQFRLLNSAEQPQTLH